MAVKHARRTGQVVPEASDSADFQELFSALGSATEALRSSHDELLQRVNDLERELAQKNRALERKHRLEALGKIAAGVAHEIRNPLGSLLLYLDLLEGRLPEDQEAKAILDHMRTGVSLRRVQRDVYEVYTTSPFGLSIKGRRVEISHDGKTWHGLPVQLRGGLATCQVGEGPIAAGKCRFLLRTSR